MKLTGIRKLNKGITALVREYICEDITCKFDTIFCISDDKLYFSLFDDEYTNNLWREWLKREYKKNYNKNFSTFVLFFLHEIGHYYTIDDFDDDYDTIVAQKQGLAIDYDTDSDQEIVEKNFTYWELPIEKAATDWAIDFYNEHFEKMQIFLKKCLQVISEFYAENS